jgi:ABC-type multidrug transport system fused ATPase/permease subunit
MKRRVRNFSLAGLANGWSSSGRTAYIGSAYLVGIYFSVNVLKLDSYMVLLSTFTIFYACINVGGMATNIPSIQKSKEAAVDVFSIIDEKSSLDVRRKTEDTIHEVGPGGI